MPLLVATSLKAETETNEKQKSATHAQTQTMRAKRKLCKDLSSIFKMILG